MSVAVWIAVPVLGGIGAVARLLVDGAVSTQSGRMFPFGTLTVNLSGAFLLGLVTGLAVSGSALVLAGTTTIGAYTTFSTWMLESSELRTTNRSSAAIANLAISAVVGLCAVALGRALGTAI